LTAGASALNVLLGYNWNPKGGAFHVNLALGIAYTLTPFRIGTVTLWNAGQILPAYYTTFGVSF
jgi:hypothetical protein